MHVSDHYKFGLRQPQLDFVDVAIETDTPLFVDPRALLLVRTTWGEECVALVQDFFRTVLDAIKAGKEARATSLLEVLHEPNETRLGLSKGKPQGHALGHELAVRLRVALASSEAVKSGLLTDLEDTILMIEGIGGDLISDITTNVIREPLVRYTQQAAEAMGIPVEDDVYPGGPFWDPGKRDWYQELVRLPKPGHPLLLVPKAIVRLRLDYDADEYFDDYIIPFMREEEIGRGSSLVHVLKNGNPRVTKKDLVGKYGSGKAVNERVTGENPGLLDLYRKSKDRVQPAMSHGDLAELTLTAPPDWNALLDRVLRINPGRETATEYHQAVQALLTPLFYPALSMPMREVPINAGRKRIDIAFANIATAGFFAWLRMNYEAATVIIECKNYKDDIANAELDQLAGRFSPNRGRFGLLMSRSFKDKALFVARCRDTANDGHGFIIPLDDDDLRLLVETRKNDGDPHATLMMLKGRFNALVM